MFGCPVCGYTSVCACEFLLDISVGVYLCQLVAKYTGVLVTAPTEPDLVLQERRMNFWQIPKQGGEGREGSGPAGIPLAGLLLAWTPVFWTAGLSVLGSEMASV